MSPSFNLLDEPWIPVVRIDGSHAEVSLQEALLEAHALRDLAAHSPLETVGILTVMLVLLHRVFGPKDRRTWAALYHSGRFPAEPLVSYFTEWRQRFDLFDAERPFYQVADERVKPKPIVHLLHSMGNTGALFTHETEDNAKALTAAQAARLLLASRVFHIAGLSGLPQKFTDAIYTRGALFYADGETLFETLALNLIRYPAEKTLNSGTLDRPAWEMDDPYHERPLPYGYLDYLTWPNTRTLLIPEQDASGTKVGQMTIAPGLTPAVDLKSPQKLYLPPRKDSDSLRFLRFSENRALWRDYAALFAFRANTVQQRLGDSPVVIEWLGELEAAGLLERQRIFQMRCLGMLADQARIVFYSDLRIPLPAALLDDDEAISQVSSAIQMAESVREEFRKALWVLSAEVTGRGSTVKPDPANVAAVMSQWATEGMYWSALEAPFWNFVLALPADPAAAWTGWQGALRSTALTAFDAACDLAGDSAHALHGEATGRRILFAGLKKLLQQAAKETT